MIKKLILLFTIIILCLLSTLCVTAHSGRTDSKGGHYNRATGEYHYHHGYPEHQHINGECPYLSSKKSNTETSTSNSNSSVPIGGIIFGVLFTSLWVVPLIFEFIIYPIRENAKKKRINKIKEQYQTWIKEGITPSKRLCGKCGFCEYSKIVIGPKDFELPIYTPNKCKLLKIDISGSQTCKIEEYIK